MNEKTLAQKRAERRKLYIDNYGSELSEQEFLEKLLCLAVNNENYKALAEVLLDRYGCVDNILNADVRDLVNVDGVSESTAVFLALHSDIKARIYRNQNTDISCLEDEKSRKLFAKNLLCCENYENIVIINLDEEMKVINYHFVSSGGASFSETTLFNVGKAVVYDNPKFVVASHNHPAANCQPSEVDIHFTIKLSSWLSDMGITLFDHVIVGNDGEFSFKTDGLDKYL